ncbi:hypothetical protein BC833DRAFT_601470 [Globomyces pollinis-pini]|nr:hypothetical protein BC833DRAFT_601470 [Globomyces pollinis-pini]
MRTPTAFLTPATLLLGLAISESIASASLLITKASDASKTILWKVAILSWLIIAMFIVFQIVVIDFLASPYSVPTWWFGFMQFMNYLSDYLATCAVGIIVLIRTRVVYGNTSRIYISLIILAVLVLIFKGIGIGHALIVSYDVWTLKYIDYNIHPDFPSVFYYLAIGHILEMIYISVGSIGFLFAIGKGIGKSSKSVYMDILLKYDGNRLVCIIVLNVTISIFGIIAAANHDIDWITHVGLYLPSITYALSFHTFLRNSYISAREMVREQFSETIQKSLQNSSGNSRLASNISRKSEFDIPTDSLQPNTNRYRTSDISSYVNNADLRV